MSDDTYDLVADLMDFFDGWGLRPSSNHHGLAQAISRRIRMHCALLPVGYASDGPVLVGTNEDGIAAVVAPTASDEPASAEQILQAAGEAINPEPAPRWTLNPAPTSDEFVDAVSWLAMNESARAEQVGRQSEEVLKLTTPGRFELAQACCRAHNILSAAWASAKSLPTREERCAHVRAFVALVGAGDPSPRASDAPADGWRVAGTYEHDKDWCKKEPHGSAEVYCGHPGKKAAWGVFDPVGGLAAEGESDTTEQAKEDAARALAARPRWMAGGWDMWTLQQGHDHGPATVYITTEPLGAWAWEAGGKRGHTSHVSFSVELAEDALGIREASDTAKVLSRSLPQRPGPVWPERAHRSCNECRSSKCAVVVAADCYIKVWHAEREHYDDVDWTTRNAPIHEALHDIETAECDCRCHVTSRRCGCALEPGEEVEVQTCPAEPKRRHDCDCCDEHRVLCEGIPF